MTYTSDNIKKLTEKEKVIKNIGMYIGTSDSQGTHHLLYEILSNSIDEALAGYCTSIKISINDDGSVTVEDNGRGIPVVDKKGKYIIEDIFMYVHMGGKFDREGYEFSGGKHGVGTTVTNYLSDYMEVEVKRDGKHYRLKYIDGEIVEKTNVIGKTKETGTKVTFLPSNKYLSDIKWDKVYIKELLNKQHYLTKGLTYEFSYKNSEGKSETKVYKNDEGLDGFINDATDEDNIKKIGPIISLKDKKFDYTDNKTKVTQKVKVSFSFQYINLRKQTIHGYTNNIHQGEGGTHVDGLKNLIETALKNVFIKLNKKIDDKKMIQTDFLDGVVGIISINLENPELSGQTKNKLGNSFVIRTMKDNLLEQLELEFLKNLKYVDKIFEHVKKNFETRKSIEKIEVMDKSSKKGSRASSIKKLVDAESKKREECELFIVEGDSAGGLIEEVRNPQTQAIFKLKGKPGNIITSGIKKILTNEEITNLIHAFGTGIGKNFDIKKLRYGKIYILSDADPDGGHIQTLLLGLFKTLMPDLFKHNAVFRIIPPLHGITMNKNGKKYYLKDNSELKKFKEKHSSSTYIHTRFKGLGEMNPDSLFETCIYEKNRISETITDKNLEVNNEFIENILGSEGSFKYNFLTNYELVEKEKVKKNEKKEIKDVASETMYDYGIYTNQDRSVPNLEDGLKPVHRRILYGTNKMGVKSTGKTVKSAQIVGSIMGSFHPHGDSSVYGAAVKLTQTFYLQNPLLNKTGNFGTVFGFDSYASMRYTELQLSGFSENILLKDVSDKKQTVPFVDNFDGTKLEPVVLPAIIPNILLIPTFGIGVGLSCQLPPHNINEVIDSCVGYLKKKNFKVTDYIKGPDFPMDENEIVSSEEELEKIYSSEGKGLKTLGNVKYRVKLHYNSKGNFIEIKSLPYNVEFGTIYEKLEELIIGEERKVDKSSKKVKYVPLPFNKSLKTEVKKIVNNSGTSGESTNNPVNIKLYLNKGADVDLVKGKLYKLSPLQTSVSVRPILINRSNRIKGYSFNEIISEFIEFRKETLIKSFNNKKVDVENKIRILELKTIYIDNADFIYKTIKANDSDKEIGEIFAKKFKITTEEGITFIDFSFRILKKMEKKKIIDSIEELKKELKVIVSHIEDNSVLEKFMIKEFNSVKKTYGKGRNSEIIGNQNEFNIDNNIEAIYEDKDVNILLSKDSNYLYKVSGKDIKIENRSKEFKEKYGESYEYLINNRKKIYALQNNKGYSLTIGDITEESAQHIGLFNKKIDISKKIDYFYTEDDSEKEILILLDNENIVKIKLENLMKNNQGFKVGSKDIVKIFPHLNTKNGFFIRVNEEGYVFKYNLDEIPLVKNVGNGVKVSGNTLFIGSFEKDSGKINININGKNKKIDTSKLKEYKRANKKSDMKI